MTKISNQYSLTNILTADLANSRLGINNVSPAYSLDLTGTARTSGATYLATASGNVGIGTIIPANALSIDEGTATASYLQFTAGTTTGQLATDGFEVGIDASANAIINQQENLPLMIYTNATERMRITSAGNLCVGNTTEITPTYNSFFLGGSKPALIGIKNAVGADVGYLYVNAGTSLFTLESAGATPLLLSTNGAERMRITSGGNIGIGNTAFANTRVTITGISTTSSNYGLVVNNSSNSNLFLVRDDGAVTAAGTISTAGSVSASGNVQGNTLIANSAIHTYNVQQYYYGNTFTFTPPNALNSGSFNSEMRIYLVWVIGVNGYTEAGLRVWLIAMNGGGTAYNANELLGRDANGGTGLNIYRSSASQISINSNNNAFIKFVSIMQLNAF
jgi:hypothetical protein